MRKLPLVALAFTTSLVSVETAWAQIEEIVVTTRKREENLQEVPIVVTAFTAASIERKGIASLEDIAKYTTGVNLDEGFSKQDTRVVIRGLSPTRGRQNVAILQDEVDISSLAISTAGGSFLINPRLLDVERIEVIKGPHSALYGRSAFNGAINYITRKPSDEFMGNAQLDVGTYGKVEGRASLSGPVIEGKLAMGINGAAWNFDGFYPSAVTGKQTGGVDGYGGAIAARFTPTDMLTFDLRVEGSHDQFGPESRIMKQPVEVPLAPNAFNGVVNGAIAANRTFPQAVGSLGNADDYGLPAPSRNPRTGEDYPGSTRDLFRNTLRITAEFEPVTFTSITHYGDNKTFQYADALAQGDFASPAVSGGQETYFDTKVRLFSQEARLQSNGDGPLSWTIGGLYWNEYATQNERALRCVAGSGQCAAVFAAVSNTTFFTPALQFKRDTYHYSAYGLAEYAITDAFKAAVEVRYTKEREYTSGYGTSTPQILGCVGSARVVNANGSLSCANPAPLVTGPLLALNFARANVPSSFWTPRFTLDYKVTPDALVFGSVAMGKKPGGLSPLGGALNNIPNNTYAPEKMWVYELGAKTTWLDGRLQINGAAYYQDYSAKQVSITFLDPNAAGGLSTRVVNAAKAEVKGFEIDITAAPTDALSLTLGYTYNDGKYKDFKDITNAATTISRASVANPNNCTVITTPAGLRCEINYSGYRLEGAPKHSLQFGAEVRGDLTEDFQWFVDTDVRYQSDRFTSFENSLKMDSYWLVDLRIGARNERYSITGYVNNLFNDDTLKASAVYLQNWTISFLPPRPTTTYSGGSAILPDKRQFGVRANVNF